LDGYENREKSGRLGRQKIMSNKNSIANLMGRKVAPREREGEAVVRTTHSSIDLSGRLREGRKKSGGSMVRPRNVKRRIKGGIRKKPPILPGRSGKKIGGGKTPRRRSESTQTTVRGAEKRERGCFEVKKGRRLKKTQKG